MLGLFVTKHNGLELSDSEARAQVQVCPAPKLPLKYHKAAPMQEEMGCLHLTERKLRCHDQATKLSGIEVRLALVPLLQVPSGLHSGGTPGPLC